MMIYLWDKEAENSLHIDLWTKDMMVNHMNIHFFHNLMNMADTFKRATGNDELSDMIREFAQKFAEKLKSQ